MADAAAIRDAILAAPLETDNAGEEPKPGTLYVPVSHIKALRLDATVVVGGRGVGKSFWTAALRTPQLRKQLGGVVSELADLEVRTGFAKDEAIDRYPNRDVFSKFLEDNGDPYDLWRAVVLRWVAEKSGRPIPSGSWGETVTWLKTNPEDAARLMRDRGLWKGLILFDALDVTSNDWKTMDRIVQGLLRAVLWLKPFNDLHAKVFLREDQAERTVFDFPDASKLRATRAELTWERQDLHGLLWQRLVNAPDEAGMTLRGLCQSKRSGAIWVLPDNMKREGLAQRKAFEALAGPWMGRDRRRGVPYTWSVNHLADGRGLTSPRSFLAAIRQAAEDSQERDSPHAYALHFESIKRGIQKASEIRVDEVAEDYPWVRNVLEVLSGLSVPCTEDVVYEKWSGKFPRGPQDIPPNRLPPQHAERGWPGVREDLERLGLLETKKDGRIDMPDLYRVGFGLGRRGGVKPRTRK